MNETQQAEGSRLTRPELDCAEQGRRLRGGAVCIYMLCNFYFYFEPAKKENRKNKKKCAAKSEKQAKVLTSPP